MQPRAPWTTPLADAMRRARSHAVARFAQLATVDASGAPRCRTVVVRGVEVSHGAALFACDARSPKVAQLRHDDRAELCWYFAGLREQFRLAGRVALAGAGGPCEPAPWLDRARLWSSLSPATRAQFAWPTPGTPRADDDVFARESHAPSPPASFVACALIVDEAELLALRAHPPARFRYARDERGAWFTEALTP